MANCPKCNSNNVSVQMVNSSMKTRNYSNGFSGQAHNAGKRMLSFATLGISDLFVRARLGEEETNISSTKVYVCQNCGYTSDGKDFRGAVDTIFKNTETTGRFSPEDPTTRKAVEACIKKGKFSTAFIQTYLGKGHNYVTSLESWLEEIGVISEPDGNKPRKVLINDMSEFTKLASKSK